ncbi:MAG: SDR family oxidoreductase [Candidatus Omnitrophica bacterium]|nr:SDR family oxidoreductase [Candidatus Omnitrophota bacterium]
MDLGIKGKYALVTGGSHGIGLATAHALAREGCHVALTARKEDRLNQAVRDIQAHDVEAVGVSADALLAGDIERVMKEVIRLWGTLHILVNNVGGGGRWGSDSVEETPEEVWKDVYHKNVTAALRFTKQALPWMRKQHWGRVVTVASLYGREGGGRPWYSMAKGKIRPASKKWFNPLCRWDGWGLLKRWPRSLSSSRLNRQASSTEPAWPSMAERAEASNESEPHHSYVE